MGSVPEKFSAEYCDQFMTLFNESECTNLNEIKKNCEDSVSNMNSNVGFCIDTAVWNDPVSIKVEKRIDTLKTEVSTLDNEINTGNLVTFVNTFSEITQLLPTCKQKYNDMLNALSKVRRAGSEDTTEKQNAQKEHSKLSGEVKSLENQINSKYSILKSLLFNTPLKTSGTSSAPAELTRAQKAQKAASHYTVSGYYYKELNGAALNNSQAAQYNEYRYGYQSPNNDSHSTNSYKKQYYLDVVLVINANGEYEGKAIPYTYDQQGNKVSAPVQAPNCRVETIVVDGETVYVPIPETAAVSAESFVDAEPFYDKHATGEA